MDVKNGEIFLAREPLQKLMEVKLPVKASYQVAKLANKFNEQLKVIDEVRNNLIRNYGEKDDKGQTVVKQESPNFQKFVEEFTELLDQEVEIIVEKIRLPEKVMSTCDSCHHNMDRLFEIEPSILMALEKFVEIV